MEGYMKERRRVYPVEPRKIMQANFATKYVNYLVPALTNIVSTKLQESSQVEKIVRHEVDMALALSAEGFAWSHALKHKLQLSVNNGDYHVVNSQSYDVTDEDDDNQNAMLLNQEPAAKKLKTRPERRQLMESEEEEKLRCLRKLIPGGNDMMVDDGILLTELGSYVSCLELQVNVLRSMLQIE